MIQRLNTILWITMIAGGAVIGAVPEPVFYHTLTGVSQDGVQNRIETVAAAIDDESYGGIGPAIELVSPGRLSTRRSDTVDGVIFSVSANNAYLKKGDTLRMQYRIRNRTMGTVMYDFNTGCQFDLQMTGSRGTRYFSFLERQNCSVRPSRITLKPSTETVMDFPPIPLEITTSDTLRVTVQMAGYPLSAVPLTLWYKSGGDQSSPVFLEGHTPGRPVVEFNHETRMLVIRLSRAERLSISAFVLTGKKMNRLSTEKFLAPGTHMISFNNRKLADGVVIFKVEGNGFSESKIINLSR